MQENLASQSGILDPLVLLTVALCVVGVFLAMLSLAANPPSGMTRRDTPTPPQSPSPSPSPCVAVPFVNDKCPAWVSSYDGPGHGTDGPGAFTGNARTMASSPDGRLVYVAAVTDVGSRPNGQRQFDYVVTAFDAATGEQQWASLFPGTPDLPNPSVEALAVSPTSSAVFVTGYIYSDDGSANDIATVAFDASTGIQLWASLFPSALGRDVAVSPDASRVYVAAETSGKNPDGSTYQRAVTLSYDAITGQQAWAGEYSGDPGDRTYAFRVAVKPDGSRVYVAGGKVSADGMSTVDVVLLAYQAVTGDPLYQRHHPTKGSPPFGIAVSDSKIFIEEVTIPEDPSSGTLNNALTLGYDSNGNELWSALFGTGAGCDTQCENFPSPDGPITVSPDGSRVFVTMLSFDYSAVDVLAGGFVTLAYDATTGEQKWATRNANSEEFCVFCNGPLVQVNPNGQEVYVTGPSHVTLGATDFTTLGYDTASGTQKWSALYREGANSTASFGIAVSPDGSRVFVAGTTTPVNSDSDLIAVAYDTGAPPPVQLSSVFSRKVHGSASPLDIDLPLHGTGIECRSGGVNGDYTMIFTFSNTLTSVGSASVTSGAGTVSSGMIDSSDAHQYVVNLTGVTNAQTITISLTSVNDSAGNSSAGISASMGVLFGDTSGDGVVNAADITQTRRQSGNVAEASNFREDVTLDGLINSADITAVRRQSGTALP